MSESTLVRRIIAALEDRGCRCLKLHGNAFQRSGEPDILAVFQGRAIFIEAKTPRGVVSPIQTVRLDQWQQAGAVVGVARSVDEALAILDRAEI